jgi:hypothetical protein
MYARDVHLLEGKRNKYSPCCPVERKMGARASDMYHESRNTFMGGLTGICGQRGIRRWLRVSSDGGGERVPHFFAFRFYFFMLQRTTRCSRCQARRFSRNRPAVALVLQRRETFLGMTTIRHHR